jgi:hypothetical protein
VFFGCKIVSNKGIAPRLNHFQITSQRSTGWSHSASRDAGAVAE